MAIGDRASKDALYEGFAMVAKGLASGRRAEIVDVLSQGERSVEDVAAEIGQSVANTSQHLRRLVQAGLLRNRREGARVFYDVASPRVSDLWIAMRDVAVGHVPQVERLAASYLGDRAGLQIMTRDDLAGRLGREDVLVLDVRPIAEYQAGHIPGARPVPPQELQAALNALNGLADQAEVVAYCRGPYCIYADAAVRHLRRRGITAARLEDGFPEWVKAGFPTGP